MRKKMIGAVLIFLLGIALLLLYPVVKIRFTSSVSPPASAAGPAETGRLRGHLEALSVRIGPRSVADYKNVEAAGRYIMDELKALGYESLLQTYDYRGRSYSNVIAAVPGTTKRGEASRDGWFVPLKDR